MKIAVCAKYVPEATAQRRLDPQTKRLDRSGEGALNQFDAHAVEEALTLKEATGPRPGGGRGLARAGARARGDAQGARHGRRPASCS